VPGNRSERVQQLRFLDSPASDLFFHHGGALGRERIVPVRRLPHDADRRKGACHAGERNGPRRSGPRLPEFPHDSL